MAYDRRSPEARLGTWCEQQVAARAMRNGWTVVHTAGIGPGPTMAVNIDGKIVMPDLQLFDLLRKRKSRLVECKAKRGGYMYQKRQIICTGIDAPRWRQYCAIDGSGVPVDLALVHLHNPLRSSPEINPKLLWQSISLLGQPMLFEDMRFQAGAAVWDVNAFEDLGEFDNPPADIIEALQAIKAKLRIWETGRPPRPLRRPKLVPGQYDLFDPKGRQDL